MSEKQPQLNGAYYGPAIPPPNKNHRPGHGSGCGCGCWLLNLTCKIIFTIVFIIGLAALIIWLIFRPINPITFHVTDASLAEFNLTADNNLQYKLAVNITVRNPNKKIGVYYDRIEARVYYEGQSLQLQYIDPFYQGHKTTTVWSRVFEGRQSLLGEDLQDFNGEKNSGVYSIDLKLYLKVRFRLGKIKTPKFKPTIKCDFKVPVHSNGISSRGFTARKCDVDF